MRVPLIADYLAFKNQLEIVRNGQVLKVDLPFKPFALSLPEKLMDETDEVVSVMNLETRALVEAKIFRCKTEQECRDLAKRNKFAGADVLFLKYMEQLFIWQPEFLLDYANDQPLKYLTWDLEVWSDGSGIFPKADRDPVIAIAVKLNDDETIVLDKFSKKSKDKEIMEDFVKLVEEYDPDVLVGYNSNRFDLPYTMKRLRKAKIDPMRMCRIKRSPDVKFFTDEGVTEGFQIHGRLHFDVYQTVKGDQTLHGIKSRGLKTVSRHFGIPIRELPTANLVPYIGTQELRDYVGEDANATRALCKKYMLNHITVAELMKVPLDNIVNGYNSFAAKIFHGRCLRERNIMVFRNNLARHGVKAKKYEGALVGLAKPGFHKKVWKVDVAGMYPSIMMTFNLSPESCRIVGWAEMESGISWSQNGNILTLRIPDENFQETAVIEIDRGIEGFTRSELLKFKAERDKLKKLKKIAKTEDEKTELESQQYALKVMMNIVYGYGGLETCLFSDLAVAVATVGVGRWIATRLLDWLGDSIIEWDTDGLYIDRWEKDLNKTLATNLAKEIKENFGLESYISLDVDEYAEAFFHAAKNYLLRVFQYKCSSCHREVDRFQEDVAESCQCGGDLDFIKPRIILHGTVFKSSNHPKLYDRAIEAIAGAILSQETDFTELLAKLKNFEGFDMKAFTKRCKINKPLASYRTPGCLPASLARQATDELGYNIALGDQIEYVVLKHTEEGMRPLTKSERSKRRYRVVSLVPDLSEIDVDYYLTQVEKVITLFGISDPDGDHRRAEKEVEAKSAAKFKRDAKRAMVIAEMEKHQMKLEF